MHEPLDAPLLDRLAGLRDRLAREYGWTHLEPTIERRGARVIVRVAVASASLERAIRAALAELELADVELDIQPLAIAAWHALVEPITAVWRAHPCAASRPELATELAREDGPVARVASTPEATLIRGRDGTQGWVVAPIGEVVPARPLAGPRDRPDALAALLAAARAFAGTPYRLGGSSTTHIDCSALVQRAFVDALDVLLPKNSNDQLACLGGDEGGPIAAGDLVFIHSRREGRTHVGLAGERDTIVQASRTRSAVVEVARADFLADAGSLARVSLPRVLAWAHGQAGKPALELPRR